MVGLSSKSMAATAMAGAARTSSSVPRLPASGDSLDGNFAFEHVQGGSVYQGLGGDADAGDADDADDAAYREKKRRKKNKKKKKDKKKSRHKTFD